jgi:hypothetical protein
LTQPLEICVKVQIAYAVKLDRRASFMKHVRSI